MRLQYRPQTSALYNGSPAGVTNGTGQERSAERDAVINTAAAEFHISGIMDDP
jgi:hypothetical protein